MTNTPFDDEIRQREDELKQLRHLRFRYRCSARMEKNMRDPEYRSKAMAQLFTAEARAKAGLHRPKHTPQAIEKMTAAAESRWAERNGVKPRSRP